MLRKKRVKPAREGVCAGWEGPLTVCSLTLLGGFSLKSGDGRELTLGTRKDRLLLAYLALNPGRPVARDRLAGLLWGDRGETQARDSLRQSLAAIRHAFRQCGLDPLAAGRETVVFEAAGIEIDAATFTRLAETPGDDAAEQAAACYGDDLLEGHDGLTPEFQAWLAPERARLAALAVRVAERLAAAGRCSPAALRLGHHLLARDAVCEPAYRAVMRIHLAAGERAAALKLYETCRDALKRELGVAPDLQTESLYRDILVDRAAAASAAASEGADERPSIAVLPFDNISRAADLDYLCDGLAEDVITGLGRFRLLFVIDRYSSTSIGRQTADVMEIGRRLGVRHLVQGSLQRHGERLRITVRLVDATNRAQLWSETFDGNMAEIAGMPDRITGAMVSRLQAQVEYSLIEQSRHKPGLAAYECLLRGIRHLRGYAPDDNDRAIALFQQAIELDPGYGLARAYRGFAEIVKHNYDNAPQEILLGARQMIVEAVQMDEQEARSHWLLSIACAYLDDVKGEERHCLRALALNPNDANATATYGGVLASLGRHEEGLAYMREAMRLNPYHPEWYWITLGNIFYIMHRYEDALEAYSHRTSPGYWLWGRLAACYAQLGRREEAAAAAAQVLRLKPDFSIATARRAGWNDEDNRHIQEGLRKAGLPD